MAEDQARTIFDCFRENLEDAGLVTESADSIICPLCWKEASLDNLSLEHVIPGKVGGRKKILTCTPCNNNHGSTLDSHLVNYQATADAFEGHGSFPAKLIVKGKKVAANLQWKIAKKDFNIVGEASNPAVVDAIQRDFEAGVVSEIECTIPYGYSENGYRTAILRAAYLIAFSHFGYGFAKHEVVQTIRRRICDPKLERPRLESLIGKLGKLPPKFNAPYFIAGGDVNGVELLFVVVRVKRHTSTYFGVYLPVPCDRSAEFFELMEQHSRGRNSETLAIPIESIIA